ncbi:MULTISPECIES: autotransporter outer membrane beta-barrel domain-containing protein [unclassified Synechococcus]|uniref:autotransporter outer membrane beta-barrel domain-containing protein n=1 Tax=unclassified Synechococcus TaxID=2626047 RepID=UPI001C21CE11|nr:MULTISPECIES: autotransporter outer membrane beta-barrel domain-containing protein [unclassified Synechococcus]
MALGLDATLITPSALLQFGTALIQEADGTPRTFDVQWRPRNGSGAVASALQLLGAAGSNGTAAAGVFDSAFNRLAIAAAGNANATGAPIGSTGFTTGQATAAGLSSDLVFRLANLLAIPSGAGLEQAVNSITPESYAAFQSVGLNALRQQRQTLMAPAGGCRTTGWVIGGTTRQNDASSADKKNGTPVCVFATGGNATATIDGRDGLSGYDAAVAGGFYGLEVQPSQRWTLGAAYGYGTAGLSNLGAGSDSISSSINSGSLYGVYKPDGPWTFKGLLGYGNYNVSGLRRLIAVGNGNPITGSTTAHGYTAGLQADYAIPLSKPTATVPVTLKPQLGVAYGAYQQDGFSESGDPTMNLNVAGHTSQSLVGTVGAEVTAAIPLNPERTQLLKPRVAVAYQVDALGDRNGNSSLNASLPGAGVNFSSAGQNRGLNDLTLSGSLEYDIASKASLYVSASYEVFSTGRQFAYGGGVKLSF